MLAHIGRPIAPHELWSAWSVDPSLVLVLLTVAALYAHAVHARPRAVRGRAGIERWRMVAFGAGMLTVVVALVSPLDRLAEALFAAHMVQHLLLTVVAAPLLVLGRANIALRSAVPVDVRRRAGRRLARGLRRAGPAAAVSLGVGAHVATLLLWHVPAAYDAALRLPSVHVTEHVTLLLGGLAFWVVVGAGRRRPVPAAGLAAFVASLVSVLLAAAMTVADRPWYTSHLTSTSAWGLSPLEDQQLAAAIMWVPGGLVYLAAAGVVVFRWIRDDERAGVHPAPAARQ